jgi:hypothetical protein
MWLVFIAPANRRGNSKIASCLVFWTLVLALAWPMYLAEMAIIVAIGGAK